jgi:glycosyltransferase involved in cell wall biosynthesis
MRPIIFSIIIPVYNRPEELRELFQTLTLQTFKSFEVIIVEDGSQISSENIVNEYISQLNIKYYSKKNEGPGLTRNYGADRATGNYLIFFDSDCLIPHTYMAIVSHYLNSNWLDAYGGPDAAHISFTPIQKAISYSMTSILTTGGIRGGMIDPEKFHPRSFNMGFSSEVFDKTRGFSAMRFGEDLDMSMRIKKFGFRAGLIKDAFVYHKRRTDFRKFYKQVYNSGIARINLFKRHPGTLKLVHFAPAGFVIFLLLSIVALFFNAWQPMAVLGIYFAAIFIDSFKQYKSLDVAILSVISTFVQHMAYGTGFIKSIWKRIILRQPEFNAYKDNFYK